MRLEKFRVARPTGSLAEIRRFYVDGLGLRVRGSFADHDGYTGLMLGTDDPGYELEFTEHVRGGPCPAPSADNLLVFYFATRDEVVALAARMRGLGFEPVAPENPYWEGRGLNFADPEGWQVVLFDAGTLRDGQPRPFA